VKRQQQYRSFDYLDRGIDYRAFVLPPEIGRVQSTRLALDDSQHQRVTRLLRDVPVISLHDHPTVRPASPAEFRDYRTQGREVTGYDGLLASGIDVIVDGMTAGAAFMTSRSGWKWGDVVYDIGMRQCDLGHQDAVVVVRRVQDIAELKAHGRVGVVFALESAAPIENELDRLDVLFGLGVRVVGLTYNTTNALGSGLAEATDGGLTGFGRLAVNRMNKLGMAIDLSHTADRTSLEAIDASGSPVTISHTGARHLWDIPRLKSDDVLKACAAAGGVVGIGAAPHTTVTLDYPRHGLDSVMEHFEYCANLIGIEHVGFGPDANFGDHVAWHREFAAGAIQRPNGLEPVEFVDGLENPSETFVNITSWLVSHGYKDSDIAMVIGGNALRVFRAIWPEPTSIPPHNDSAPLEASADNL
jgi:membrane dipeptidase